jgi:hypothetical protein
MQKPEKKPDSVLFALICQHIREGSYVFLSHAKKRLKERAILDIEVLDILEAKPGKKRRRNKNKDSYEESRLDWNYCIEGVDLEGERIRIIISFDEALMPIITVIRLSKEGEKNGIKDG